MTGRPADAAAAVYYQSIAATAVGRLLGRVMNCLPLRVGRIRLSHVLMAPVVTPLAVLVYLVHKLTGRRFDVTATDVRELPMIGSEPVRTLPLTHVAAADVRVRGGQAFFNAGDVVLSATGEETPFILNGVSRPDRVCESLNAAASAATLSAHTRDVVTSRSRAEAQARSA